MRDKVVWVTGASSGIGRALAVEYARLGWKVILTSRRAEKLEEVRGICSADGERMAVIPADLSDLDGIPRLVEKAEAVFGKIDLLINNAGQSQRDLAVNTEMKVYEHILRLDLLAAIALTKGVLPGMIARKSGHIAAVTSIAGKFGAKERTGYSAAKFGLHGFFDSLRTEVWEDNITVSLIVPAFVRTESSINALIGDGTPYGILDQNQAEGMSPEDCAKQIVRGLRKKKREFYVALDGRSRMGLFLNRYFPGRLARILRTARAK